MDFFLAACQGFGLALAAGTVTGAVAGAVAARDGAGPPASLLAALAAVGLVVGAILFGMSLSAEDHPAWPGWLVGALTALLAFSVISGVVRGAATRIQGASPAAQVVYLAVAAAILAGLSVLLPPIGLIALAAVGWLAVARRQRATRKHEGLRVLR
ncbi:MAG TPA: hypothetical protein VK920_05805 [Solirubrobacterales bacterium]|nr:hypothetical protein [Solirubrobacterales bacterium]